MTNDASHHPREPDALNPDALKAAPWHQEPLEIDRYIEGEVTAAERSERDSDVAQDAALAARLQGRRAFLTGLAAAGRGWRTEAHQQVPPGLESRVRFALRRAEGDRRKTWRWVTAAAAVLIVTVALSLRDGGDEGARAMPLEVIKAADAARQDRAGPRSCNAPVEKGPMQFPPVKDGTLRVWRCNQDAQGTVAKLYRPEDLPTIGYAAVAAEGVERGPDLGMTDLGDMVVYDLVYGRRRHYLAVSKTFLDAQRKLRPGRESCRACHNRSREGKPNPHNIVQRSWQLGG